MGAGAGLARAVPAHDRIGLSCARNLFVRRGVGLSGGWRVKETSEAF